MQRCRCAEVQLWCYGAEVKMSRDTEVHWCICAEVQRCRGAEQMRRFSRGKRFRGAVVQGYRGADLHRCRCCRCRCEEGRCRGGTGVQICTGVGVVDVGVKKVGAEVVQSGRYAAEVQMWCRSCRGADVQRWCRGGTRCRGGGTRCKGTGVKGCRSAELQRCRCRCRCTSTRC
jgi:hypothetical protein